MVNELVLESLVAFLKVKSRENANKEEDWKGYAGNQQRVDVEGKAHRQHITTWLVESSFVTGSAKN